jgi:deoxyxylulose-5-phosphate synthase
LVAENGPSRVNLLRALYSTCADFITFAIPDVEERQQWRSLPDGTIEFIRPVRVPLPNAHPDTWTDVDCAEVLAGTGYLVHSCLKAAEALQPLGIAATVIDAYALPLDAAPVLWLARSAGAPILTVEDSYVGGIGSEIAEAAAASGDGPRVRVLAVRRSRSCRDRPE